MSAAPYSTDMTDARGTADVLLTCVDCRQPIPYEQTANYLDSLDGPDRCMPCHMALQLVREHEATGHDEPLFGCPACPPEEPYDEDYGD